MSVSSNQYLAFGYMVNYKLATQVLEAKYGDEFEVDDVLAPFYDSGYTPGIRPHKGINIISDGMEGEFFFIGMLIEKAETDIALHTVSISTVKTKDKLNISAQFYALFGKAPGEMNLDKPGWHVINHFH